VTTRLEQALALVDVRLLDHIVVGGHSPQPVRTLRPNSTVWRVEDVLALIGSAGRSVRGRGMNA
jgi:hypothetical protein